MGITLDTEIVAKYVLQVTLGFQKKTRGGHMFGAFQLWRKSGLFGMSDELMKFCPRDGCLGFFRDSFYLTEGELAELGDDADNPAKWPRQAQIRYATWFQNIVACPLCGSMETRERLPDNYVFNMSKARVAGRMADFFRLLDHAADVYLVRFKKDHGLQEARTELRGDRTRYVKLLGEARDHDNVYYGLKDVLRDVDATSGLEGRFQALLGG
jgi:hypothetical protein